MRSKLRRSLSAIIRLKQTNTKSRRLSGTLHRLHFVFPAENETLPWLRSVVVRFVVVPILSGSLNEYWFYICCECVIAIWRLCLWHPLVARNHFFPCGWASMLTVHNPLDLILIPRLDSVHLKPKRPPVKLGDSDRSGGEQSVIWEGGGGGRFENFQ